MRYREGTGRGQPEAAAGEKVQAGGGSIQGEKLISC